VTFNEKIGLQVAKKEDYCIYSTDASIHEQSMVNSHDERLLLRHVIPYNQASNLLFCFHEANGMLIRLGGCMWRLLCFGWRSSHFCVTNYFNRINWSVRCQGWCKLVQQRATLIENLCQLLVNATIVPCILVPMFQYDWPRHVRNRCGSTTWL
jgi:hypothetical protein